MNTDFIILNGIKKQLDVKIRLDLFCQKRGKKYEKVSLPALVTCHLLDGSYLLFITPACRGFAFFKLGCFKQYLTYVTARTGKRNSTTTFVITEKCSFYRLFYIGDPVEPGFVFYTNEAINNNKSLLCCLFYLFSIFYDVSISSKFILFKQW